MTQTVGAVPRLAHAEAAARLRTVVSRMNRLARRQYVGDLGPSHWSALVSIETAGQMHIGDLADWEHVSPPTATRLVACLERRGLVIRAPDPQDRRSAVVSLTAAGREALAEARRARTAWLARRLATLDGDDLHRVIDALPVLERIAAFEP